MDVDDVGLRIEMVVPDAFEQHGPSHHLLGVAHQELQELVLERLQRDRGPRAANPAGQALEAEIAERRLADQRVVHMAHHDALTGLPNRTLLADRVGQAIARAHRSGGKLAVLFLDLDRFKNVNDSFGHAVGDMLLTAVSARLTASRREGRPTLPPRRTLSWQRSHFGLLSARGDSSTNQRGGNQ